MKICNFGFSVYVFIYLYVVNLTTLNSSDYVALDYRITSS
jgi:hypothetical protein